MMSNNYYAQTIFPRCQGIAKCAAAQKKAFNTNYLLTGQVTYGHTAGEQRLDDLYGIFINFEYQLPASMSDKDKKAAIRQCLYDYYHKRDPAGAYINLGVMHKKGGSSPGDNAATWFVKTQAILNPKVDELQVALEHWKI